MKIKISLSTINALKTVNWQKLTSDEGLVILHFLEEFGFIDQDTEIEIDKETGEMLQGILKKVIK